MKKLLVSNLLAASIAAFSVGVPTATYAQIAVAPNVSQDTASAIVSLMNQWNSALAEVNAEEMISIYVPEDREYVQQIMRGRIKAVSTGVDVRSIDRVNSDTFNVRFVRFWGGARPGRANVSIEVVRVGDKFLLKVPAATKAALSERTTPAAVTPVPDAAKPKVEEINMASGGDAAAKSAQKQPLSAAPEPGTVVAQPGAAADGLSALLVVTTDTKPKMLEPAAKASRATPAAPAVAETKPAAPAAAEIKPATPAAAAATAAAPATESKPAKADAGQIRLGAGVDQQAADALAELISKWNEAIAEVDVAALTALHIPQDKELVEKFAANRGKSVDSKVSIVAIEKMADDEFRIRIVRSWGGSRGGKATNVLTAFKSSDQYLLRMSKGPMPKSAGAPVVNSVAKQTSAPAAAAPVNANPAAVAPAAVTAAAATPAPAAPVTETKPVPAPTAKPEVAAPATAPVATAKPAASGTTVAAIAPAAVAATGTAAAAEASAPKASEQKPAAPSAAPSAKPEAVASAGAPKSVEQKATAPSTAPAASAAAAKPAEQKPAAQGQGSVIAIDDTSRFVFAKVGHATLIKLPIAAKRVAVGDPNILDFKMISPRELYVLGKSVGTTNMILWEASGESIVLPAAVNVDLEPLSASIRASLPQEQDIKISSIAGSVVFTGTISDGLAAKTAIDLAGAFIANLNRQIEAAGKQQASGGQPSQSVSALRVIDLLRLRDSQQVMLDVRIAEISKDLLEQLGVNINRGGGAGGNVVYQILSRFPFASSVSGPAGSLSFTSSNGSTVEIQAEKRDSLVKILAEPSIVAMSGQEGSFLAGGTVFLPAGVSSGGLPGQPVEKEYGVSLKFVPTVLDGGRINLKVAPEVSELNPTLTPGTNLPSFMTRKVSTSVQLRSGQSLLIGGLLKSNLTEAVAAFPVLGELPIIGALFRSSDFTAKKTELVIFVSPSLVKSTETKPETPTDSFVPPSRTDFFLQGSMEKR